MDSAEQGTLRLVLEGEGVSPESIHIKDLTRILETFTKLVAVAGGSADEVALVDIRSGSVDLAFRVAQETSTVMADVIAGKGADGSHSLGPDLDAAFGKFRDAVPSHAELAIEVVYGDRVERTRLEAGGAKETPRVMRGQTTLYGLVTGVNAGGKPTARMRVIGENRIVVMPCSVENARVFGGLILRTVRVEGVASWNFDTYEMTGFEVLEVQEFSPAPLTEAVRGLAQLVGDAWADVDVPAEVARLRGDDEKGR